MKIAYCSLKIGWFSSKSVGQEDSNFRPSNVQSLGIVFVQVCPKTHPVPAVRYHEKQTWQIDVRLAVQKPSCGKFAVSITHEPGQLHAVLSGIVTDCNSSNFFNTLLICSNTASRPSLFIRTSHGIVGSSNWLLTKSP